MKRSYKRAALLLLVPILLAMTMLLRVLPNAARKNAEQDEEITGMITAMPGALVENDGYLSMTFRFLVNSEQETALRTGADRARVFLTAERYDERAGAPTYEAGGDYALTEAEDNFWLGGVSYNLYSITLYGLGSADYDTRYTARLFFAVTKNGVETVYSSPFAEKDNAVSLFDAALMTYCDRTMLMNPTHPYETMMGDYSPCRDLTALEPCLASRVLLEVKDGEVVDLYERQGLYPIYTYHYFDGVLTISLDGADLPEGVLRHVVVNGTDRWFEVSDGKVRLGIE